MTDIERIAAKLEMLEARCVYLGVVCSAMLRAMPDNAALLAHLQAEVRMHDANSLYATSLSDRQQQLIQTALDDLEIALRATPDLHSR